MKRYSIPLINISVFEREDVITQSGPATSAFDEAKEAAEKNNNSKHVFTVELMY